MNGMMLIASGYFVNGFTSSIWQRLYKKHFEVDKVFYRGITKARFFEVGAEYGKAYDAALAYAHAMTEFIRANTTITGPHLAKKIRQVSFKGLTGNITFDDKGDRPGFMAFIVSVRNGSSKDTAPALVKNVPKGATAQFSRYIFLDNEYDGNQSEVLMQASVEIAATGKKYGDLQLPNSSFLNRKSYSSRTGMISRDTQEIIEGNDRKLRREFVVAPFYCSLGCGGKRVNPEDITIYEHGYCVDQEICQCHLIKDVRPDITNPNLTMSPAYSGPDCSRVLCIQCKHGLCVQPEVCSCDPGWKSPGCTEAICRGGCIHGTCNSPNVCDCNSGYIGTNCHLDIVLIVVPLVIGGIGSISLILLLLLWYKKRLTIRTQLENLDWLVDWNDVVTMPNATSTISNLSSNNVHIVDSRGHIVHWKSQRCYAKFFNYKEPTDILLDNIKFREEIMYLRKLNHGNIVRFLGLCLTPCVALLLEFVPKGSLQDLLASKNVKITWEIKYSLIREICQGMHYLHTSDLGVHGELRSSVCLIDNRWTCKISGFGLSLLRKSKKTNDMIFGIILNEICTNELPFSAELQYFTQSEVITILTTYGEEKWQSHDSSLFLPLRPHTPEEMLPESSFAQKGIIKLMNNAWNEDSESRPSFRQAIGELNRINQPKGLVDNLINRV
uniref:guanylate cyclase n=1 Tax=Strigamia maritima TaxID=126957 RepID=T1ISD4_STRMM